jgi:hypothetical protein
MSESNTGPTRDPIEALENFGTGGIAVNPLEPAAVRRLGDKRRRRQNTMYGAIAAVAVAAAVIPTAILATSDGDSKPPPILNSTAPDPTPTIVPEPTPIVITFPGGGVTVESAAETGKLTGTTPEFKAFIGAEADKTAEYAAANCPEAAHGIVVKKYHSAGFAQGDVSECGGYVALWVLQDGAWKEAIGTQETWQCGDLTRFSVPDGFAGECYGPKALFGPDDDGALKLGMTADEVRAAGGTVTPGTGCDEVAPRDITSPDKSALGYLSPTPGKGVVALFAQNMQETPRGIRQGASLAEVKKAYPEGSLRAADGSWAVPVGPGTEYRFSFADPNDPTVSPGVNRIALVSTDQDCFEDTHP